MHRLLNIYNVARGITVFFPFLVHLIVADTLLSLLLPVSFLAPSLTYNICSSIAAQVWVHIQIIFESVNGAQISLSAKSSNLPPGESAIVIANHVSWTDFYMIQTLARRSGMLSRCRWFAKAQLKWVPLLGWGLWAMGMPLVTRDWTQDRAELSKVFEGILHRRLPIWLISYSEGTRFTQGKFAQTLKWCKENEKPFPQHTLFPRPRGFVTTVQELRSSSHVRCVYDVTVAYAGRSRGKWEFMVAPTMWESLFRPNLNKAYRCFVHVDRFLMEDLPEDDHSLRAWLETRWEEKSAVLEGLRKDLAKGYWDGKPIAE